PAPGTARNTRPPVSGPIGELGIEDLRLLIGQQIGLAHLVPVALVHLQQDPLVQGDFYEGDLLAAVLRVDQPFWDSRHDHTVQLLRILANLPPPPQASSSTSPRSDRPTLTRSDELHISTQSEPAPLLTDTAIHDFTGTLTDLLATAKAATAPPA
ncbi:contact-dependent growth inhibition system immunity protein, partial [Streptodolium elevatio]